MTPEFWAVVKRAHELAGLAALIVAVIAAVGFTISSPWITHEEFKSTKGLIETVQRQQSDQIKNAQKQNCIILQLLRDRYLKEQIDAQEELNKNPTSPTLQRARDEARAFVEYLDTEQRIARCRHLRAPISSSTERPLPEVRSPLDRLPISIQLKALQQTR